MSEAKKAIFEKLQDIIAKQLSIDPVKIKTTSIFTSDLKSGSFFVIRTKGSQKIRKQANKKLKICQKSSKTHSKKQTATAISAQRKPVSFLRKINNSARR